MNICVFLTLFTNYREISQLAQRTTARRTTWKRYTSATDSSTAEAQTYWYFKIWILNSLKQFEFSNTGCAIRYIILHSAPTVKYVLSKTSSGTNWVRSRWLHQVYSILSPIHTTLTSILRTILSLEHQFLPIYFIDRLIFFPFLCIYKVYFSTILVWRVLSRRIQGSHPAGSMQRQLPGWGPGAKPPETENKCSVIKHDQSTWVVELRGGACLLLGVLK